MRWRAAELSRQGMNWGRLLKSSPGEGAEELNGGSMGLIGGFKSPFDEDFRRN